MLKLISKQKQKQFQAQMRNNLFAHKNQAINNIHIEGKNVES